jgi:ABC-type multidrug transport system fused ATPase/permease subunit
MQIEGESTRNRILNFDFKKEIVFKNVSFKYHPDNDLIFKSLNLKIKKGETIGLIGSSGSGKSTFVDILIGLLSPTSGDVTVDNYKIDKDASSWQKKIGYISQDIHLIDDSIINNIALGVEEDKINLDSVNKAINSAQLQSFIKSLSNGINTHVGDKGVQISGGQKQRIGLARALYHNPEILILDEATSSLDDKTESEVMKAIELLSDDKTVIIIAHRLSTLGFCKKIFELKNSKFKKIKL